MAALADGGARRGAPGRGAERAALGALAGTLPLARSFVRGAGGGLGAVLCQSEADRDRWLALGAPVARTAAIGNLKNDGLPAPVADDRGAARAALGLDPRRPLLTLGNVRPGEGATLAAAWRSLPETIHERWQVAAVPRHPHAAPGVRREIEAAGVKLGHDATAPPGAWRLGRSRGVLASYYCAGEVAVVGGSFGPYGGHNPLEPAACGAAVVAGPHLESQRPAAEALTAAGGLEIVTDDRARWPRRCARCSRTMRSGSVAPRRRSRPPTPREVRLVER